MAVFDVSPAAQWRALEEFISHARAVVPVAVAAGAEAADIRSAVGNTPTVVLATPQEIDSADDPGTTRLSADAAALSPTTTFSLIPESLLPIIGPIILFAPLILLVVLACPPCALFNFVTSIIRSILIELAPVPAVPAASAVPDEADPTANPSLASEPEVIPPARVTATPMETAGVEPGDAADTARDTDQVTEPNALAGREIESMPTDMVASEESTSDVTEDVGTDELTESAVEASETETGAEITKPTGRPRDYRGLGTHEPSSPKRAAAASSAGGASSGGVDSAGGDDSPGGDDGSS